MSAILEVRGLRVRRGADDIIRDLSFDVERGTLHAITGPNGSGKSTLLSAVLGLLPFEGTIQLRVDPSRPRVGFVPQRFAPDRTLPVNVADFLAVDRQKRPVCFGVSAAMRRHIAGMLERVALGGIEGRLLSALSGGQLQRVLLAHALDPLPELLILDEPGAGLDRASSELMERVLLEVKAQGVTTLLVSHDHAQVQRLADATTELAAPAAA